MDATADVIADAGSAVKLTCNTESKREGEKERERERERERKSERERERAREPSDSVALAIRGILELEALLGVLVVESDYRGQSRVLRPCSRCSDPSSALRTSSFHRSGC